MSNIREISISQMTAKPEGELYCLDDIKGSSEPIRKLKYKISCVANTDSTVLIYGETGTGKELVAESIHSEGRRKDKKFVAQNCAAIPPTLLESILFGTEKGSFTGAESRSGIIESAQGGTLFSTRSIRWISIPNPRYSRPSKKKRSCAWEEQSRSLWMCA